MDQILADLRFAGRTILKNPGFVAVVVLTLGLGIGANTAIFTLMDQVLMRPLPVKDPQRLVLLDGPGPFSGRTHNNQTFSHPMYLSLRDNTNGVFEGVLARFATDSTLTWRGKSERVFVESVSGNYFQMLGVGAAIGRTLTPDDDKNAGSAPVVMLSHGFWKRRFGGDPSVIGQSLSINNRPMDIVGVAEPGFGGIEVASVVDVFVPITQKAALTPTWDDLTNWRSRWVNVMARLAPGLSREQAEAGANVAYRQALTEDIKTLDHWSEKNRARFLSKHLDVKAAPNGLSSLRQQVSGPLLVLMGMVGLVLLIACANVANLLMARATARQKEVAIRLSLGASRGRLIRQLLVESVVLALLGAVAGVVLAAWTGDLLLRALPFEGVSQTLTSEPDARVGLFTLAVSLVTGILFGLAPALQLTRPAVAHTLKDEAAAVIGGAGARLRRGLVVAQVALSLLLLVGAGLFARSLHNLRLLEPGFEAERLLVFSVDPPLAGYDQTRVRDFATRLQRELQAVPGVQSAAPALAPIMADAVWRSTIKVEGYTSKEGEDMSPQVNAVAPTFFATLGAPILSGRDFDTRDGMEAPKVAIVNETLAKYFWGKESPIGKRFGFARDDKIDIEIVGVVKDGKVNSLREEIPRMVYVPLDQQAEVSGLVVYARTNLPEAAVAPAVRQAVGKLDATLPIYNLKTMQTQISESLFVERMVSALSAAFGLLATMLAAVGLYGVMSYSVSRRTREIGIRLALGAPRQRVLGMVLREVGQLGLWGLCLGLPAALALARLLRTQLFGLAPHDPLTIVSATLLLACVTLAAGLVPARRAMRVDPILALRYE
jgi:predicted permease